VAITRWTARAVDQSTGRQIESSLSTGVSGACCRGIRHVSADDLDDFEKWCVERGHYHALPLIENFRRYRERMRELEMAAKLKHAGQSDEHQTLAN